MHFAEFIPNIILSILLVIASVTDLLFCKIPNRVTFPAMLCGITCFCVVHGVSGFMSSLAGIILGVCLLLPLYLIGGMGAGDVKLLGAVGSVLGPQGVFTAFLYTAIVGGIYALLILAKSKMQRQMVERYGLMARAYLGTDQFAVRQPEEGKSPPLCYGLAISLGTMLSILRPL